MKLLKTKKVGQLDTFIKGIVGVAIVLGVGLIVLSEFRDSQITGEAGCTTTNVTACGDAYKATGDIIDTLADIPTWVGIIVVVAMAALVMAYFYFKE